MPLSIVRVVVGMITNLAIFAVLLFVPAGTWRWPHGWIFLGVAFIGTVGSTFAVHRRSPALLAERMKSPVQRNQPAADRILVVLLIAVFAGWMSFIPLDVFRLHGLARPGPVVSWTGLALLLVGWCIITAAMLENPFAAPVVKLQQERGHQAVGSGVYGAVRHPMYAGTVVFMAGTALWLESYAALLLMSLPAAVIVLRILAEERFLKTQLEGYEAYTRKVPYRLIPLVW